MEILSTYLKRLLTMINNLDRNQNMNQNEIEPGENEFKDYAGEEMDMEMFPTPDERKAEEEQ